MFVVMGATGQTGGAALRELQGRGAKVRAITRDPRRASLPEGVEVAGGDPTDSGSLRAAFAGAQAVYVMLPNFPQAPDALAGSRMAAQAIANAVREARVPRVVALSSGGAHLADGTGMIRTLYDFETVLRGTAASITFLRAADFMENWASALPVARSEGVLPSARTPLGAPTETVSTEDIGFTAAALMLDRVAGERIVNLFGPQDYSPVDAAAVLSRLLGRPVTAVPGNRDDTVAALLAMGASSDYAEKVAEITDGLNAGRIYFEPVGERRRGNVSLEEALQRLLAGAASG
ncbi:MAG: NAD(P)H-binding protein [Rhodospirillales bacterium]|nr:NAD(P)H-binding protein [Rhodospirillales bacterium]